MQELWERQIGSIVEKELAKSSFGSLGETPKEAKNVQEQVYENVRRLRLGYETGRKEAPEIGCPLYLDTNSGRAKLELIGYYVGGADEILANHPHYLEHAIRIYQNLGLLGTMHVLRKLRQYADKGSEHKTNLDITLNNLAIFHLRANPE